jgi:hypothetical protein
MADSQTRYMFYRPRGTVARVFIVHVANCTIRNNRIYHALHMWPFTRGKLCHVYGLRTRGDLQVAKCNLFYSIMA